MPWLQLNHSSCFTTWKPVSNPCQHDQGQTLYLAIQLEVRSLVDFRSLDMLVFGLMAEVCKRKNINTIIILAIKLKYLSLARKNRILVQSHKSGEYLSLTRKNRIIGQIHKAAESCLCLPRQSLLKWIGKYSFGYKREHRGTKYALYVRSEIAVGRKYVFVHLSCFFLFSILYIVQFCYKFEVLLNESRTSRATPLISILR
mmetsp:Transcript_48740/g.72392  ORF Transcript_48740/g.72392 Transcript_48740/m.72392 type:complete len:201 (+) Transcript_48740:1777-2379(+)